MDSGEGEDSGLRCCSRLLPRLASDGEVINIVWTARSDFAIRHQTPPTRTNVSFLNGMFGNHLIWNSLLAVAGIGYRFEYGHFLISAGCVLWQFQTPMSFPAAWNLATNPGCFGHIFCVLWAQIITCSNFLTCPDMFSLAWALFEGKYTKYENDTLN